ncbi:MAG: GTPase ObgE [Planctomycetales bacterium]|nr:GTPase ObgE [Planctomycetales bacterium]
MFVDRVQVELQAGKGGDGCVSFRREKYVPNGGPDGGNGGHGGSIVVVAEEGVNNLSLLAHRKRWKATRGQHGEGSNRHGRHAEDLTIRVPPGTVLIDADRNFIIRDLVQAGDSVVAARGGRGGWGNNHYKSSTNRAPREFTRGEDGELRNIIFELKVIADVGLVGKPNAGKSTLLSRLSRARPEIADYPFTTKHPNLGQVQIDFDRGFVMADIPGLIEGAHAGVGLGHEFLRHIERAGILVHLVEPAPIDGSDPLQNYRAIREELTLYNDSLGQRPEILVVTKAELPEAAEIRDQLGAETNGEVLLISAVTGLGLNDLTRRIVQLLEASPREATD